MNLIAAVDKNWAIGKDNKLLVSIPDDMKFFREATTGHVVVMGRKTLESFPNGKPLKDRINIVLTRDANYKKEGALIVHSVEELEALLKSDELAAYADDEVYVIGGESIYRLLLDKCDRAYITYIDEKYSADAYFPNLDERYDWRMAEASEENTYFDIIYEFRRYERVCRRYERV